MKFCSECKRCFDEDVAMCAEGCGSTLTAARSGDTNIVAGYNLDYLLETGVRGDTFRARRIDCGRKCLIKIVNADTETAEEFLREAEVAKAIFHHGITATYEAGRSNEKEVFVVTEDPHEQTLRDLIDAGTPELLTTIRIARQTAEAVQALHSVGVQHRAINPSNIFISTDHAGELLVRIANIDLGGAVERAIVSNKFLIDTAIESLRYFAPEQCTGKPSSEKTDVYALGIVLYEMLSGTPPFDAANAAGLIEKHLSMQPPDIKINNFDLRMLLSHTLMEALQKQPSLRQASADVFARQIRHIEQLATHVATPPPVVAVRAEPRKATPRVNIVTVPDAELDIPSVADAQTVATASFTQIAQAAAVSEARPDESYSIPIDDAYSETLGPRIVSRVEPGTEERHGGLLEKAVSLAAAIRDKASTKADDSSVTGTIDFRAAREQIPALLAKAKELDQASPRAPKLIEWEQPLDDIPSLNDTFEVSHIDDAMPSFEHWIEPAKSASIDAPVRMEVGAEEVAAQSHLRKTERESPVKMSEVPQITIVSTRQPSVEFVPAFLTAAEPIASVRTEDRSDMFAAIDSLSAVRFPRARRVVVAAAAFGIIAFAFMIRGDIVDALTPYDLAAEYPVLPVRSAPENPTVQAVPSVAISAIPDIAADQPKQDTETPISENAVNDDDDKIKPITVGTTTPRVAKKEADNEQQIAVPSRPQKASVALKTDLPLVPSTLVITPGKPSKIDRDPFAAPKNAAGMTRPRIVKNPNP